jgi:hypothetical protein
MARNIPTQTLAKLAQTHGVEPVLIIAVTWALGGKASLYATKNVRAHSTIDNTDISVQGKILEVGTFDSVVAISLNETSEQFDMVLDDSDGALKDIIDTNDIMLRDVVAYQWFEGLDWDDRFVIFQGKINSPISWSETDRTIKMSVVSQLEDKDVGFSPEEGEFPDLPDDMVGKLWPECFGTSLHQKVIQVDFKHSGTLGDPVGLADFTIPSRIAAMGIIIDFLNSLGILYAIASGFAGFQGQEKAQESLQKKSEGFFVQAGQKGAERAALATLYGQQKDTEVANFRVIGGEHFPRGPLQLEINEAVFGGTFIGPEGEEGSDIFVISCSDHPEMKNYMSSTPCGIEGVPIYNRKSFPVAEGFSVTQQGGDKFFVPTGNIPGDQAGAFFAQGGAGVTIFTNEPLRYFVSITPGTVVKVAAFTTFQSGEHVLVDVPTNAYRVYVQNYGSVSVTVVEVKEALSKLDPAYEDAVYVTFRSSVGPNPIDIMKYLISKYADIPYDTASFAECRAALENYPMHFCLTQKKNIVMVLKELAFMSRTAISIKSGKFFCRYLPAEPTSEFTFTENNILTQSLELGFTDTEQLVTKYVASWRAHGAQEDDNKVVLRYNVKKYGTHETTIDFYAFNYISAIVKTLTFWINRRGHTWKKLRFSAALDALNIETFDGVTLDFDGNYASNGPVLGYVENGNYNPDKNTMDFVVWTGVRAGDMESYDLAYPQNVSTFLSFPDPVAEAAGFAGGDGPGNSASGNTSRIGKAQGVNVTFKEDDPYEDGSRKKQDRGSKKPSDIGDKNPGAAETNDVGSANQGVPPPPTPDIVNIPIVDPGGDFWIDIRTTEVSDSDNPGQVTTFSSFFYEVTDAQLKGRTSAIWKNDENDGEFEFKWSGEDNKFGAGIAFLKD